MTVLNLTGLSGLEMTVTRSVSCATSQLSFSSPPPSPPPPPPPPYPNTYTHTLPHSQYRRHKASAVSRLRKYLMKTLRSFTKIAPFPTQLDKQHTAITGTGTGQEPGMENEATEDPMEEADTELVIDTAGVGAGDPKALDAGERTETETEAEEGMESENLTAATLELVDQMEIEISDHEGGGGDTESGGDEKSKKSKQTSATAAGSGAGKSGAKPEGKDAAKPQTRRRRHSSTLDKTDFPPISLERQLSDDEIIDLMNLLHVCCALKIQAQMYLKDEEAAVILGPIACSCPPFSPAGVRFVEVALCILLACPFLIRLGCWLHCSPFCVCHYVAIFSAGGGR